MMKKFLFLIFIANLFSAQNPLLLNTDWHILKYGGEQTSGDLYPPPMPYLQTTTFSTSTATPQLNLLYFNAITANLTYSGQNHFTVSNKSCTLADYFGDSGEVNQFFGALCNFFNSPVVNYTIQVNGVHKTLILNNAIFQYLVFSGGVLSTKESEISKVTLAPNPADDNLMITNAIEINSYKIFEGTGKLVDEKKNLNVKNLNINIQNYQTGVYFIKINDDKAIKFIKK